MFRVSYRETLFARLASRFDELINFDPFPVSRYLIRRPLLVLNLCSRPGFAIASWVLRSLFQYVMKLRYVIQGLAMERKEEGESKWLSPFH